MEKLTKENFWNDLMEKYPEEMKQFCAWIDEYKERVDWKRLFNTGTDYTGYLGMPGKPITEFKQVREAPKYHDLPIAMQVGIFFLFTSEQREGETMCALFGQDESPNSIDDFVTAIKEWFKDEHAYRTGQSGSY